jgi:hypothetical protein
MLLCFAKKQKEFKMAKKLFLVGITIMVISLFFGCSNTIGQNSIDETSTVVDSTKAKVTIKLPVPNSARALTLKDNVDNYRLIVAEGTSTVFDQTVTVGTGSIVVVLNPGPYTFTLNALDGEKIIGQAIANHTVVAGLNTLSLILHYSAGQMEITAGWEDETVVVPPNDGELEPGTVVPIEAVDVSSWTEGFFGTIPTAYNQSYNYDGTAVLEISWNWSGSNYYSSVCSILEKLGWTLQSTPYEGTSTSSSRRILL